MALSATVVTQTAPSSFLSRRHWRPSVELEVSPPAPEGLNHAAYHLRECTPERRGLIFADREMR